MKNSTLIFLLILVLVAGMLFYFQDATKMSKDKYESKNSIMIEEVVYHEEIDGFLARPTGEEPFPALVLIHEWWGLNDNIKGLAKRYAQNGYVALAVDMYGDEVADTPEKARKLATSVREDMDTAFENLKGAIGYLKDQSYVQGDNLGSVGWCFGGGWSYEIAKNDLGVKSSVIYYGRFNPEDDLSKMKATIMGHFGETDRSILVDDVKAFEAKLKTLSGEHRIFIYENAGHGFANEDNESAYHKKSADIAWERTVEFFERELR